MSNVEDRPTEERPTTGTPEQAAALRERIGAALREIVGERWVTTDPMILDTYTWQYGAETVTSSQWMERPLAVVLPADTEQVAEIVRLCNREGVQFKAISTGFGAWGAASRPDSMVQIDLHRMDRILEIDETNMYTVVEPYVTANQLQTETFKIGLHPHVIGAGAQSSVLASATSMFGAGWDGISTGFSNRNLLGFEWVTPEGEIVRVGSFDATGRWFSGDGPGPSLRGVIRGQVGASGGLGVFTKAALKLYPWRGPEQVLQTGTTPFYAARIPAHHFVGLCLVDGWERLTELAYRIGDAEIADYLARNAPSLLGASMTVDNNEFAEVYSNSLFAELRYMLMVVICASDREEHDLKVDTLKRILRETGGGMFANLPDPENTFWAARAINVLRRRLGLRGLARLAPGTFRLLSLNARRVGWRNVSPYLSSLAYLSLVRSGLNIRGVFRFAGTFVTSMGALASFDSATRGAQLSAQVKRKYIERGVVFDDGTDNAWGETYENGAYSHMEQLACYDPSDPEVAEAIGEFGLESSLLCLERHCGLPLAFGPAGSALFSESCDNYDDWQQRIKAVFDPANASEASFYVEPDYAPDERTLAAMQRIAADRASIDRGAVEGTTRAGTRLLDRRASGGRG
jgi:glycolate oxidase